MKQVFYRVFYLLNRVQSLFRDLPTEKKTRQRQENIILLIQLSEERIV